MWRQTRPETIPYQQSCVLKTNIIFSFGTSQVLNTKVGSQDEIGIKLEIILLEGALLWPRRIELRTPGVRSGKLEEDQINFQQIGIHLHFSEERMLFKPSRLLLRATIDERIVCRTTCGFWFLKAIHFSREGVDWGYLEQVFWSNVDALPFVSDN